MIQKGVGLLAIVAASGMACSAFSQDSVSKNSNGGNGLPGDAISPWSVAAGSQRQAYALDLAPLWTSCGTRFGIAPIIKTSKSNSTNFNSLTSANGISSTLKPNSPLPSATYGEWLLSPGYGLNSSENFAADSVAPTLWTTYQSTQFAVTVAEFATSDGAKNTNNVITAVANYDPARPDRLWVTKVITAVNESSGLAGDTAQFGIGSVDSDGSTYIRADDFGLTGPNPLVEDNIFRVRAMSRNGAVLNQIDNAGGSDAGATNWLVVRNTVTQNTPSCVPAELGGPTWVGTAFDTFYWREGAAAGVTTHRPGTADHRGAMSFSQKVLFAGVGTGAMLTQAAGATDSLSLWAVNADGTIPAGKAYTLTRPVAGITDPCTGFTFTGVFEGYRSQVGARGGNGLATVTIDAAGNGLAAATMYSSAAAANPYNAIAAVRFNPSNPTGTAAWSLVAWNNTPALSGKNLKGDYGLDGAPFTGDTGEFDGVCDALDAPIGRLASLLEVTGGGSNPVGPSMSAPVFDSAGNCWFVSAVALKKVDQFGNPITDFDSALIRGVYDQDSFCWDLELVMELGDTFDGRNSGVPYQVQFLEIADSNSLSSGTMFSNAGNQASWNNLDTSSLPTEAPEHLGGLVVNAKIVYDVDGDGDFSDPTSANGDPNSADEAYQTVLYIGNVQKPCPTDFNGDGFVTGDDFDQFIAAYEAGDLAADYNHDGFTTGDDFDAFVADYEAGCE